MIYFLTNSTTLVYRVHSGYFFENISTICTQQGAQLSTTLYKIYHNDLLKSVGESGPGTAIGNINVSTPTCADDAALLANSPHELQAFLDLVEFNTFRELDKINPDKSDILTVKYKDSVKATFNGQHLKSPMCQM
ncbi:hypothetical protein DPMN_024372 [Dreissena polymorpha]|uniref:Reverse transcriptase domain-containing protein n=1 Tax=Dreissena polymorpha TaxID=45954 RepID=A0A9D4LMU3_DREPO|nr:hypothetical protein DPMN_024372 [Dreissena polymorpha]